MRQVSDEYRFLLEIPGTKHKEVNLTLYNNRLVIR